MKNCILLLIALLAAACGNGHKGADPSLERLYTKLDADIDASGDFEKVKDERIAGLKREYAQSVDENRRTEILNKLIEEFNAYNADSTLYYIGLNLRRPAIRRIPGEYTRMMIKRGEVYAHAGLFSDALATMQSIPRDSLDDSLLEEYYSTYCATYQYLSEYTSEHETDMIYIMKRSEYTDSLNKVVKPGTFNYLVYVMSDKARKGDTEEAIKGLSEYIDRYKPGTREYSILASTLAYIYKTAGYEDDYKRYLVLSAISDVRAAVKENMSFRALATVMFEDDDIERANRYLKKSIADANFYSALLRNAQSSKMIPVIDEAYSTSQKRLNSRLRMMVWLAGLLSVVLVITILFILKQYRSLRIARDKLSDANGTLSDLYSKLKSSNDELESMNRELREYNRTKEEYAGLFMGYCSTAISTLQHYQLSLRKIAVQGGNKTALLKKLESTEAADQLLKDFYMKFDEAILNIYPDFITRFNQLLYPDRQITLRPGELLNTELRIFALIRMGIDDSNEIAQFLRCSLSTVYTYRSKMKKRAVDPDNFEREVRNIG